MPHGPKHPKRGVHGLPRWVYICIFILALIFLGVLTARAQDTVEHNVFLNEWTEGEVVVSFCDTKEQVMAIFGHETFANVSAEYRMYSSLANQDGDPICGYRKERIKPLELARVKRFPRGKIVSFIVFQFKEASESSEASAVRRYGLLEDYEVIER